MNGTIEYTKADGKIDGGRIVELIKFSAIEPEFRINQNGYVVLAGKTDGETRKYVVAIAEVD